MTQNRLAWLPVLIVLLMAGYSAKSQSPLYFKAGTSTVASTPPLNTTAAKTQLLYRPNDFQVLPPSGSITKIYLRSATAAATGTFTNFQVKFLQNADTAFPNTTYYTGLTTALTSSSFAVTGAAVAGGWFEIPLPAPYFSYSNAQTLIVEIQYTAKTNGISTTYTASTGNKRLTSTSATATTGTLSSTTWNDFGMDVLTPCVPGSVTPGTTIASVTAPVCTGTAVTLSLSGASQGLNQSYQWETAPDVAGVPGTFTALGTPGTTPSTTITTTTTLYYRAAITCGTTTVYSTPVLITAIQPIAGGTYTIDNSQPTGGTNYNTFTDAVAAMNCGVAGPMVFNVANNATPYDEQVMLMPITGTSATNTITFNGNGATLNFDAVNASQRAAFTLDGADFIRIKRLNIVATGTANGYGVQMINSADNNVVDSCTIVLDTLQTGTTWGGIIVSGSMTTPTTTGSDCDNLTITNNVIDGGFYGITILGASTLASTGHVIARNDIRNPYQYGIYLGYVANTNVEANEVSRLTRAVIPTSVSGIYVPDPSTSLRIHRNRIHDLSALTLSSTVSLYGVYHNAGDATAAAPCEVSNNLIYNFKNQGLQYGLFNSGSDHVKYYHNTISLDDATSATTAVTRGFYQTTAAAGIELKNNIISVTRGGTGVKHAVYFATAIAPATNGYSARNNVYYVTNPGTGGGIVYRNSTNYPAANFAAYQTTATQDTGSVVADPVFMSINGDDYTPATSAVNDIGVALPQIPVDLFGNPRSATTPDPGAIEFNFPPCSAPPTAGTTTSGSGAYACVGNTVTFGLQGNSIGAGQTYQLERASTLAGPYAAVGSSSQAPSSAAAVPATGYYRFEVKCGTSTAYSTPLLVTAYGVLAGGTYTINNAQPTTGTNFNSFTEAAAALSCGISGPVVFNVANNAAPYGEQFALRDITGTSATNTITFNGNGATLIFNSNSSSQRSTILLNGADFVRIKRLNIAATGTLSGVGIQMISDANNNVVDSCTISVDSSSTAANFAGIAISGSLTGANTGGSACDSITITNNVINGGYYGITALGASGTLITRHIIARNVVKNFYIYGVYVSYTNAFTIDSNDISRPTRTTLSTFYGVYAVNQSTALRITRNRIHDPATTNPANTSSIYGIYHSSADALSTAPSEVSNNLIYNFKNQGILYGMYNSSSDSVRYYHNTISLDDAASTTANTTRGFYQTTAAAGIELKNNIISVTRGGTGVKHAVYFATAIATANGYSARNNVYYVTNPGTSGGIVYRNPTNYPAANFAAYQTASAQDTGSVVENPFFPSVANGNLTPATPAINNIGVPIPTVPVDIFGTARSTTTPDPGAIEFNYVGCGTPVAGVTTTSATTQCSGQNVTFGTTGGNVSAGLSYQVVYTPALGGSYTAVGASSNTSSITVPVTATGYYRIVVSCGALTDSSSSPVFVTVNGGLPAGTYTINNSQPTGGTNFNSFTAAANATFCGIGGPIVFNVANNATPYNEQFYLPNFSNSSAVNTVTFNGNGATLTFNATVSAERALITLDGTDYVRIRGLNIVSTGTTYGVGIQMTNDANHNVVDSCRITMDSSATGTGLAGIAVSGSLTSATTTGSNCDSLTLTRNVINGGYYGIALQGASAAQSSGNLIARNTIKNFYSYGIYASYLSASTIDSNDIFRPGRTTLAAFYGVYLASASTGVRITRNRIHDPAAAAPGNTSSAYGIYHTGADGTAAAPNEVSNNLIYSFRTEGLINGIYNAGADYVRYYHNTVSLDDAGSSAATTNYTRGFYQTTAATGMELKNNIFSISRGGTAEKQVVYFNTPATTYSARNNNYYLSNPGTNGGVAFYNATNYPTLTAYRAASLQDTGTTDVDPVFTSILANNYQPTSASLNNTGIPLPAVPADIFSTARSTTAPDPGAIEFTPGGCTAPPVAGLVTLSDTSVCGGTQVAFGIAGGSSGLGQTYVWESAPAPTGPFAPVSTASTLSSYSQAVTATAYFRAAITCSGLTSYSDTQRVAVVAPLAGGAYTINAAAPASATNFQSFGAAVYAMRCGITGAVVMNVAANSGPYNEQVVISNTISGVSATNTITFNGNNNVLTFNSTTSNSRAGIRLDGADWVTINNLAIVPTGTYGYGVHLTNDADHNTIRGCTITLDSASTTTNYGGIVVSGSLTSAIAVGSNCDSLNLVNNTINGGYYGITLMGSTTAYSNGTLIKGNTVRNPYTYGIYSGYVNATTIDSNNISRPTRLVFGTFNGVYIPDPNTALRITRNRIHDPATGDPTATDAAYGIYHTAGDATAAAPCEVSNNLIYNFRTSGTTYGFYNSSSDYVRYVHNTVALDDTTSTATATYLTRGIFQTGAASGIDVRNNIFSLRRTGATARTAIYFATATTTFTSNYNDLYVAGGTGTNNIGYYSSAYTTLGTWQSTAGKDTNSVDVNPQFAGGATGSNLTPTNFQVNNLGQPIGIVLDAFGSPRSLTVPDIGAIEFTAIQPCNAPTALTDVAAATTANVGWTASSSTNLGYEFTYGTSSTPPTGAGTPVSGTSVPLSGLTPNTVYYYCVRTVCGPNSYSAYVCDSFKTCAPPPATLVALNSSTPSAVSVCEGDTARLKATGGAGNTYVFLLNGSVVGTGSTPDSVLRTTVAGTYRVVVTNATGCFDTSAAAGVAVTVNPLPVPGIQQINFNQLSTGTFTTYQWNLVGSGPVTGATTQTFTTSNNGSYTVTVTDANGCRATSPPYNLTTAGVGDAAGAAASVRIFPNPTTGVLFIESSVAVDAQVWTMDGRKLLDVAKATQVNIGGFAAGVYMLRIVDANGAVVTTQRVTKTN